MGTLPRSPLQGIHPGASEGVMPNNPVGTQDEREGNMSAAVNLQP